MKCSCLCFKTITFIAIFSNYAHAIEGPAISTTDYVVLSNEGSFTKNFQENSKVYEYSYTDESGNVVNKAFHYKALEKINASLDWVTSIIPSYDSYTINATLNNVYGAAIQAKGGMETSGNIVFSNNYLSGNKYMGGGAVYTQGKSGTISADFINNGIKYTGTSYSQVDGGAIHNAGSIDKITGNFINNYIDKSSGLGGAIYNIGTIEEINAVFIDNYSSYSGGAIQNDKHIDTINGIFIDNKADTAGGAVGIAIRSTAGTIDGTFIGNSSEFGGAINVMGTSVTSIKGDYINNSSNYGGAVEIGLTRYDSDHNIKIGSIEGNFIGNNSKYYAGALSVNNKVDSINANFIGNYSSSGGAMAMIGIHVIVDTISGNFINNTANGLDNLAARGGGIARHANYMIDGIQIVRSDDTSISSGPYWQNGYVALIGPQMISPRVVLDAKLVDAVFAGNKAVSEDNAAYGGAVYNNVEFSRQSSLSIIKYDETDYNTYKDFYENDGYYSANMRDLPEGNTISKMTFINSSFINNSAESANGEAKGGAIYSNDYVAIIADNGTSVFRGNTANGESSAIYIAQKEASIKVYDGSGDSTEEYNKDFGHLFEASKLVLEAKNNGILEIDDDIDGYEGYPLIFETSNGGQININGNIKNAQLIGGEASESLNPASTSNAAMNIAHADNLNYNNSLTMNTGTLNIRDLGLSNLRFNDLELNGGVLNVAKTEVDLYAQKMGGISAENVTGSGTILNVQNVDVKTDKAGSTDVNFTDNLIADKVVSRVNDAYGPVYSYEVAYDPDTGNFTFTQTNNVNPDTETTSVAGVVSAAVLSDEIYSRVLADIDGLDDDKSSVVCNRGLGRAWVKTFGSDESIDLKNFQGVDSRFYGLIAGIESGRINEGKGWSSVYNVYGAYAQGEQKFSSEKVDQIGGYLGATATFYKGDFFIGTTANAGTLRNKAKTADGKDKFNSYLGGIGMKVGYNYRIMKDLILQPNVYGSYTYVDVNDYTTGKGAKVKVDGIHNIEIAPGLKLAKDFGDDARGYVKTRYVFNFNEGQDAIANGIDIPNVEMKDYVEYGLGYEKLWSRYDLSAFIEIMRRDGGREGWTATAGVKWNFR